MKHKNQGINAKNLKIQAIETSKNNDDETVIVVAINQPYLLIFREETFTLKQILKIESFENGTQGILALYSNNSFIIWN